MRGSRSTHATAPFLLWADLTLKVPPGPLNTSGYPPVHGSPPGSEGISCWLAPAVAKMATCLPNTVLPSRVWHCHWDGLPNQGLHFPGCLASGCGPVTGSHQWDVSRSNVCYFLVKAGKKQMCPTFLIYPWNVQNAKAFRGSQNHRLEGARVPESPWRREL